MENEKSEIKNRENITEGANPTLNYFHNNILTHVKERKNILLLFLGTLYLVSIISFFQVINTSAEKDFGILEYSYLTKSLLYFLFGVYLIYNALYWKAEFTGIAVALLPVVIFITFALIEFIYCLSSDDIQMLSDQSFDFAFSTPLHLITTLILIVIIKNEDVVQNPINILHLIITSLLLSLIFLHLVDLIVKAIRYYRPESVSQAVENNFVFNIISFFVLLFGVFYTFITFYPVKIKRNSNKPLVKYCVFFPIIAIILVYILSKIIGSVDFKSSVFVISFIYIILITIILTGTEFLRESNSPISRSIYKINLFFFTSHIRIFNKYKKLLVLADKDNFENQSKKPTISFIFSLFQYFIFLTLWLLITGILVVLILSLRTNIDLSGSLFIPNISFMQLLVETEQILAANFYKEIFIYIAIFFFHLPIISILLTFVYELLELIFRKYFTTVFFETKEINK